MATDNNLSFDNLFNKTNPNQNTYRLIPKGEFSFPETENEVERMIDVEMTHKSKDVNSR